MTAPKYHYTEMSDQERNRYTVGELLNAIDGSATARTEDLMKATEIGQEMLVTAINTADDQGNAEFFAEAYSFYGPLVDTALEEMGLPNRDTVTGATR